MSGLAPRDVDFVTGLRTAKVITSGCRCARVIEVMMAARAASVLEVVLVSGVRVAVPAGFDEATLRRVLTVLEGD
jgi:hypothetical protein